MSGRHRPPQDSGRRRFLGGLAAAALVGTFGSVVRGWWGGGSSSTTAGVGAAPSSTGRPPTTNTESTSTAVSTSSATSVEPTTTGAPTTSTEAATTSSEASTTSTEAATPTSGAATTTSAVTAGGTAITLFEKAAWGARPEGSGLVEHQIGAIMVHHTAVVLGSNANAPARFRQHQRFHQEQGWADIAYHVMIDREGNLYEGRPMWAKGDTFTEYDPTGYFLPCVEGDYDSETPTAAQLEALARLCAWAANRWGIDPAAIVGHRDEASTTCPGGNLYSHVAGGDLAARVGAVQGQVTELAYLRGEEAAAAVAAIEAGG